MAPGSMILPLEPPPHVPYRLDLWEWGLVALVGVAHVVVFLCGVSLLGGVK